MKLPGLGCGVRLFSLLLVVLLSRSLLAGSADQPVVQVEVEPETVNVGESVTLRVSVYSPTWFPQPPEFPSFELPNTVTRLPANSSGPVSARVGRSTWSGIQRRYQIVPLIPGEFQLGSRRLSVTYADPESTAPRQLDLQIPPIAFSAGVPAGAQGLDPYLAGENFELRRELSADISELTAGDALEVRYLASLEGLPSIFLPTMFSDPDLPGLAVYPQEPVFSDEADRAVREETVTLVFDSGGDFTLPGIEFRWWNSRLNEIAVAQIPPLTLTVAGPPPIAAVPAEVESPRLWMLLIAVLVVLSILVAVVFPQRLTAFSTRWRRRREAQLQSEIHAFRSAERALQTGEDAQSYRLLVLWVERLEPGLTLEALSAAVADSVFAEQLEQLRRRLFADPSSTVDLKLLAQRLASVRQTYLSARQLRTHQLLPMLNPR